MLAIFDPCFQAIAHESQCKDDQPGYEYELELNEDMNDPIGIECMTEDKPLAKKRVSIYEEDDVTIASWKNTDYFSSLKDDDSFIDIIFIDHSTSASSRLCQNLSAKD